MKGKRNPVAQHNNEFNKPKTYRDRKKHPSKKQQREHKLEQINELHHPLREPYRRKHENLTHKIIVDGIDDDE